MTNTGVRVFFTITISDIRTSRKKVGHDASGCHSLALYDTSYALFACPLKFCISGTD